MVFRMLAVLAEFERDQIAERTMGALSHRNEGKRISGRIPYGYDLPLDSQNLLPNEREQAGLRLIVALRKAGRGCRRITAALNTQGIATKTGTSWSPQAIGAILKRGAKMQRAVVSSLA